MSELVFSAEVFKGAMARLEPLLLGDQDAPKLGKVVIGTVKNDIHDIGKNIVAALLKGTGFEVLDLGVDVPAERFVQAVQDSGAKALGLSALLSTTYPSMKQVVGALQEAGVRDYVKVILGGAPVNQQVLEFAGADYLAKDAVDGVNLCKQVYGVLCKATCPALHNLAPTGSRVTGMYSNTVERKIMWGDLDSLAIVFYPRYYEWFDGCANLFMESIGLSMQRLREHNQVLFGLVKTSAEYYQPGRYHQGISITTSISELTRKTVSLRHLVNDKGDGGLMVMGLEKRICMDLKYPAAIQARQMPDDIYEAFQTALSGS